MVVVCMTLFSIGFTAFSNFCPAAREFALDASILFFAWAAVLAALLETLVAASAAPPAKFPILFIMLITFDATESTV
jgi:hypothetical protein